MRNANCVFELVGKNGIHTNQTVTQIVDFEVAANGFDLLRFEISLSKPPKIKSADIVPFEFRLERGSANNLIQMLNGTVSVGYAPVVTASFDAVDIKGKPAGKVVVSAALVANAPPTTALVQFSFCFFPSGTAEAKNVQFLVGHVDASLVVGMMNAVSNTNDYGYSKGVKRIAKRS